jgi:hypothetical protein
MNEISEYKKAIDENFIGNKIGRLENKTKLQNHKI